MIIAKVFCERPDSFKNLSGLNRSPLFFSRYFLWILSGIKHIYYFNSILAFVYLINYFVVCAYNVSEVLRSFF